MMRATQLGIVRVIAFHFNLPTLMYTPDAAFQPLDTYPADFDGYLIQHNDLPIRDIDKIQATKEQQGNTQALNELSCWHPRPMGVLNSHHLTLYMDEAIPAQEDNGVTNDRGASYDLRPYYVVASHAIFLGWCGRGCFWKMRLMSSVGERELCFWKSIQSCIITEKASL